MRRIYTDLSRFRSPLIGGPLTLTGLGAGWPAGRSYYSTHRYLSPYQEGYFQSNDLSGATDIIGSQDAAILAQAAHNATQALVAAAQPPFYRQPAVLATAAVAFVAGYLIGRR
jgi:hypothetical protein